MRWLLAVGLVLGLAGLGLWRLDTAGSQSAQLTLSAPGSVTAGGGEFQAQVGVQGVANLAAYEWQLAFDPNVIQPTDPPAEAMSDGGFLDDTGRSVSCVPLVPPSQGLEEGNLRLGCVTTGSAPGVSGSGLLSTVSFVPIASGATDIRFVCAQLSDRFAGDIPISNVPPCGASITPTPGPGETPPPTSTPVPGAPTATPPAAAPTATPTGPTPTPTPIPPGWEAIALVGGCQFEAWTGADGTDPGELAGLVGPAGNLRGLWAQQPSPTWRGYSPQFPDVSDMGPVEQLDVLALCTSGPGDFVRPLL